MKKIVAVTAFLAFVMSSIGAYAESNYEGMAKPWQLNFQPAATPVMEKLNDMHTFLLWVITIITILVLLVMIYICLRFRRKANPVASKTTHNTLLEVIWTTIPILILIVIAIPSIRLHYYMQEVVNPEMTLKVVGYQWYWHYEYPDQGGFGFDSYIKKGNDLKEGDHRLLAVDNRVVVPVDTVVRVQVTGADVIHSWAVPAFGVKKDGVPGRLNETWFKATKIGTFFGQCSELCGVGHGFMPIVVDVVSKDDFAAWVVKKKQDAGLGEKPAEKSADKTGEKHSEATPADKAALAPASGTAAIDAVQKVMKKAPTKPAAEENSDKADGPEPENQDQAKDAAADDKEQAAPAEKE